MKTKVYMVRHGETEWNYMKKFQGMSDIPLNEIGEKQAGMAKGALTEIPFDVCFCSPLIRARQTAQIICDGQASDITPQPVDALHEMNAGEWEGLTGAEIIEMYPEEYDNWCNRPKFTNIKGGETFQEVQDRALEAFWQIVKENQGKTILLVSHMVFLSSILDAIAGVDLNDMWAHPISNAGINLIEVEEDGETAQVALWNEDNHLPEEYRSMPMFRKSK